MRDPVHHVDEFSPVISMLWPCRWWFLLRWITLYFF